MKTILAATQYSPIPNIQSLYSANPLPTTDPSGNSPIIGFSTLGDTVSAFYSVTLLISISLCFVWLVWGVFQYIVAGGDKEALGKARSRITWALFGLLFIALAYLLAQMAAQILEPRGGINF